MQTNQNVVLVSETHVRLIEFAFPIVLIIREGFTKTRTPGIVKGNNPLKIKPFGLV